MDGWLAGLAGIKSIHVQQICAALVMAFFVVVIIVVVVFIALLFILFVIDVAQ